MPPTVQGMRTRAIHGGVVPRRNRGATTVPLYYSSSFAFERAEDLAAAFEGRHPGWIYSRISNPTVQAFEQRVAALEGGGSSLATASGMAAIQALFYALTDAGSEVVFSRSLFGGTVLFLRDIASRAGVRVTFVDLDDASALEAALSRRPRLVFFETVGNPRLDIPPIERIVATANAYGVPSVIDATLCSPALFTANDYGAAAVIHSATKLMTGNGTAVGGVITDLGSFDWSGHQSPAISRELERVGNSLALAAALRRHAALSAGLVMSPFNAFLSMIGLETLPLRADAHCRNALALARFLCEHPRVESVRYPGLPGDPYHDRCLRYFHGGCGSLLTFGLADREAAFSFMNRLQLALRATNLGDAKTLVIHPASTIFHDCSEEERAWSGVTQGLIRVSVGLEDVEDIIADFDQALSGADKQGGGENAVYR